LFFWYSISTQFLLCHPQPRSVAHGLVDGIDQAAHRLLVVAVAL